MERGKRPPSPRAGSRRAWPAGVSADLWCLQSRRRRAFPVRAEVVSVAGAGPAGGVSAVWVGEADARAARLAAKIWLRPASACGGARRCEGRRAALIMRLRVMLVAALLTTAPTSEATTQSPTQSVPPAVAARAPRRATIDSLGLSQLEEAGLMGVAGIVFVDGQRVWSKGYGHRDYLRTQPFTTTTPMSIASITKTFTGVAMMRLVAEGKLDLDADVNRYLPFRVRNPRFPDTPVTLRMIATHTSSITDRWEVYRTTYNFGSDVAESLTDFITSYFAPDGRRYSADNYTTVAPGAA